MLLGAITKLTSGLLGWNPNSQKTQTQPETLTPVPPAPVAAQPPATASTANPVPGVVFDLSPGALQAVTAAQGSEPVPAAASVPLPEKVSPFLPAAMTIAAEIAALDVAQAAAAQAQTQDAQSDVTTPLQGAPLSAAASPRPEQLNADPDEEALARAHAIRAQDHSQLRSLVEDLAATRSDRADAAPRNKSATLAA